MKNRIITALILLVSVTLLAIAAFSPAVSAEDGQKPSYDYTHGGSGGNVTLGASDITAGYLNLLGEELSDKERQFLDSFGTLTLTYSSLVPQQNVTFEYNGGILTVTATDYSYVADGGVFVWYPTDIDIDGRSAQKQAEGVWHVEVSENEVKSIEISVIYRADVEILARDIDLCANLYYGVAKYVSDKLEYEEQQRLFKEYRIAKRVYDEAYAAYSEYLDKLDKYNAELALYEQYERELAQYNLDQSAYLSYLAAKEIYDAEEAEYEAYLRDMEIIAHQLSAVELVKVKMTDNRSLYNAVMGGTVDEVLNNESVITGMLGVNETVVHRAGDATERVRGLMTEFYALATPAERYNYYLINYESFKSAFKELTVTLDKLYRYPRVRGTLIAEGKDKKYIILVAQLALVTNAFFDEPVKNYDGTDVYDSDWKIENKTINQILGTGYYEDNVTAVPIATGYPTEKTEPIPLIPVEKPTRPTEQRQPIKPQTVEDPGQAPKEVTEPSQPVAINSRVLEIYGVIDENTHGALAEAYAAGECRARDIKEKNFLYNINSTVERSYAAEMLTATFLDEEGNFICAASAEAGYPVVYEGDMPIKADDEFGSYVFVGWQTEGGTRADLCALTESVVLYPAFDRAPTYYNVTWIVNGVSVTERVISQTVPVCPIPTDKADEGSCYYVFAGWDKPVSILSEDVTYTAVYDECYVVPFTNGGAALYDDGHTFTVDSHLAFATYHDLSRLLPKIAGERDLIINTAYGTLLFSFTDVMRMHSLGVSAVDLRVSQKGISEMRYRVDLYGVNGEKISAPDIGVKIDLICNIENTENAKLYYDATEGREYIDFTASENTVAASLLCGTDYRLELRYTVTVSENAECTVTVNTDTARPGELVTVSVQANSSTIKLTRLTVLDSSGNEIEVGADGSFRMPHSNVTVMQHTELKYHTVTFVASGKVVSTYKVLHGTAVTPPEAPAIQADNLYTYEFERWYPKSGIIVTDTVFTAIYKRTLIPYEPDPGGLIVTDGVLKLIVLGAVACGLFVCGVVPAAVILTVNLRRRAKMFKKKEK